MSKIAIKGAETGTGVFTLESPATNTDRTLILPDEAGTVLTNTGLPAQLNATGFAPIYAARAWVNFNGTGTVAIRAAGNVSSITDNAVGDYTVNFTTAMPDGNYSVNTTTSSDLLTIVTSGINGNSSVLTTSSVRVTTWSTSSQVDRTVVAVAIFR